MQVNSEVRIGSTVLAGTGKRGKLTPDADGYYTIPLGMYGTNNSAGLYYDGPSGAAMFKEGTPLMRRLRKGVLFMEFKHPEPWEMVEVKGEVAKRYLSDTEYLMRIRRIDDDRVCGHIKELILDHNARDENGKPAIMVLGKVKPYGPFGQHLQDSLDNPDINTYASVRSITNDDMMRGIKYTQEISTWDMVGEGGILKAGKYHAPSLEAFESVIITPETLRRVEIIAAKQRASGLECGEHLDVSELRARLGWAKAAPIRRPAYLR